MKRAGVIGYPIGHSVSPAIHNAAFAALGIDGCYEAWETPPEDLAWRVASLRSDDAYGANVTVPHKQSVIPLVDTLSDVAQAAGAVNTIINRGGHLAGFNTDVAGFARALIRDAEFDPTGRRCLVLGAGGAGRAVAFALLRSNARLVTLADAIDARAVELARDIAAFSPIGSQVRAAAWGGEEFGAALAGADLVVNATPLGMAGSAVAGRSPLEGLAIRPEQLVFDLVYNPEETPLLAAARAAGARAFGGLNMLVYQAAESFKLWTRVDPPVDVMLEAARQALAAAAHG